MARGVQNEVILIADHQFGQWTAHTASTALPPFIIPANQYNLR